ncbi:S-layer homology domain-containing protein [Anaerobacillus sp. MEB173]|uniref:S-layer homology domain-containing protein n=1 Tax=Anaerobacillus sp. MEB173 TaxID=3383345 RepID=UPI003F92F09D
MDTLLGFVFLRYLVLNINSWYEGYVAGLVNAKITTGKTPTTFAPNAVVTHGEAATLLYRAQLLRGAAPKIVEIY